MLSKRALQSAPAVLLAALLAFASAAAAQTAAGELAGTRWLAEDIEGRGVIDRLQSMLEFQEGGKVAGSGGCNRYFGNATIEGEKIAFGPLGATQMACEPAVNDQERRFFAALAEAASFAVRDGLLFIADAEGNELLRFSRME